MKNYYEDFEKLFNQESREKKRIGSNVNKRALRRGGIRGGMKTPSDFLSAKEKKALSGEVKVYNIMDKYKDINNCKYEELQKLDKKDYYRALKTISENISKEELGEFWGIKNNMINNRFLKVGIQYLSDECKMSSLNQSYIALLLRKEGVLPYREIISFPRKKKKETIKELISTYPYMSIAIATGIGKSSIGLLVKNLELNEFVKVDRNSLQKKLNYAREKFTIESVRALEEDYIKNVLKKDLNKSTKKDIKKDGGVREFLDKAKKNYNVDQEDHSVIIDVAEEEVISEVIEPIEENTKETEIQTHEIMQLKFEIERLTSELENAKSKNAVSDNCIKICGEYTREQLEKRLIGATHMINDECRYKVNITIEEI